MKWRIFCLFQNFKIQIWKKIYHVTYFWITWLGLVLNEIAIDVHKQNGSLSIINK